MPSTRSRRVSVHLVAPLCGGARERTDHLSRSKNPISAVRGIVSAHACARSYSRRLPRLVGTKRLAAVESVEELALEQVREIAHSHSYTLHPIRADAQLQRLMEWAAADPAAKCNEGRKAGILGQWSMKNTLTSDARSLLSQSMRHEGQALREIRVYASNT